MGNLDEYEQTRKYMIADEVTGYTDLTHQVEEAAEDSDGNTYDSPTEELDDDGK